MKTSWKRCLEFSNLAQAYAARTKDQNTKLYYALNRVLNRIAAKQAFVNERIGDIEIDHCVTNEVGVITRDDRGDLQYTKEGIRERIKARRQFMDAVEIEIDPYFATALPDGLTELEIEAFAGFVISDQDARSLLAKLEAEQEIELHPERNGDQPQVVGVAA